MTMAEFVWFLAGVAVTEAWWPLLAIGFGLGLATGSGVIWVAWRRATGIPAVPTRGATKRR